MRKLIKILLVVSFTVMIFSALHSAHAGGPVPTDHNVTEGVIQEIIGDNTIIVKDDETFDLVEITGFPIGYLQKQMIAFFGSDFIITPYEDCVTVEYAVCDLPNGETKLIAVFISSYCHECHLVPDCFDVGIQLRDEEFHPVREK